MINPHKPKYYPLYWSMVQAAADQTVATRHKVGAVVVTPTGMLSIGWNGAPSGLPNVCEDSTGKTLPTTLHAERNAIDKMTRQGVPTQGSVLFVSRAPCFECAKALHGLGLRAIYYREQHDDMRGVEMLRKLGILVEQHFTTTEVQQLNTYYQRGPV